MSDQPHTLFCKKTLVPLTPDKKVMLLVAKHNNPTIVASSQVVVTDPGNGMELPFETRHGVKIYTETQREANGKPHNTHWVTHINVDSCVGLKHDSHLALCAFVDMYNYIKQGEADRKRSHDRNPTVMKMSQVRHYMQYAFKRCAVDLVEQRGYTEAQVEAIFEGPNPVFHFLNEMVTP